MISRAFLALLIIWLPQTAHAHLVSVRFGEFYSGLLHPLTSFVHLLPWLALALFAATQGQATARQNLLIFPPAVAVGVLIGATIPGLPGIDAINIASFVILGGAVAFAFRTPALPALAAAILFGLTHGYANGIAELPAGGLLLYVAGVTTTAYLISALIAALALSVREDFSWGAIAVRVAGSWIVASGLVYGGFQAIGPAGV